MGYTNYNFLRVKYKRDNRKNPVATITVPYELIKSFKWEDGDLIFFNPYKSKFSQDISLVNLIRCPTQQFGGEILKFLGNLPNKRINWDKNLRKFPPKRRKMLQKFREAFRKSQPSS